MGTRGCLRFSNEDYEPEVTSTWSSMPVERRAGMGR